MNTEQIQDEIERIASEFPFISEVLPLHRGPNTIKMRLKITPECFAQASERTEVVEGNLSTRCTKRSL